MSAEEMNGTPGNEQEHDAEIAAWMQRCADCWVAMQMRKASVEIEATITITHRGEVLHG